MNAKSIRRRKLFFSWQDEKQEAWLGEMSRQGLHLRQPGSFGNFLFVEGPGKDTAYRLDYNQGKAPEDYLQLIRDAGWEYLGTRGGWQYWRKEIKEGEVPEIYTDPASKIQKYQRLLAGYVTSAPALYVVGLAIFKKYPGLHPSWFVVLYITLFMSWILFAAINAGMILMRINALKKQVST